VRNVPLILLVLLLLIGNTVGLYAALTSRSLQVWDFQPLWQAGRWIVEGRDDPYSAEMTRLLQVQSYGRPAREGEDPRAFVYPLYVLLLVAPLIFLPLPWAQAAWFTMLEAGLIFGAIGSARLAGWRLSLRRMLLVVACSLMLYPLSWALILGQVSIPIFALMIGTLLSLRARREVWAGICLALTTAKPQMTFLLAPALLLWGLGQRRYRFALSFIAAMGMLLLLSFAVLPGWPLGLVRAGAGYFEVQPFSPPVAMLGEAIAGEWGWAVTVALVLCLLVALGWAWRREWHATSLPLWAIGFTLVVTALIAPRTSMVNQVMLLLPLCALLADLARCSRLRFLAVVIPAVLVAGLWAVDLLWFPPLNSGAHWHAQQQIISPILPVLLLIGLAARPWLERKGTYEP
jgi:hypothetical protein